MKKFNARSPGNYIPTGLKDVGPTDVELDIANFKSRRAGQVDPSPEPACDDTIFDLPTPTTFRLASASASTAKKNRKHDDNSRSS
jgi:hypothetical protein